ncbi:MAG: response regulator [Desulfuromonadales bacterium]|nr:response regulator [Desulfuromonadales bacterium]MBN2791168.1 response regulator [Desulfuromonadales bacterium]
MMKKLLLADDSITIQKVVGIIFATEDFELTMTDDGNSALAKAKELLPDLVIADISMPGMDGFELCRAIKSDSSLAHTSVLLLPGAFDHFDEARAQEVCADGWLTKPFESQALLDKVAQLVEAEPVRLADSDEAPAQDASAETQDEAEMPADDGLDETVLGLNELDALEAAAETEEESPDDIWDAVSFEEDDLQSDEEVAEEEDSPFEAAFVEPDEITADGDSRLEETAVSEASALSNQPDIASEDVQEDVQEPQPVELSETDIAPEASLAEEHDFESSSLDEADTVDFSTFEENEPKSEESGAVEPSQEEDVSIAMVSEEEPLELTEDFAIEDFPEVESDAADDSGADIALSEDEVVVNDTAEAESDMVQKDDVVSGGEPGFSHEPAEDQTDFEADVTESESLSGEISVDQEGPDILDLAEEEIIDDDNEAVPVDSVSEDFSSASGYEPEDEDLEPVELLLQDDEASQTESDFSSPEDETFDDEPEMTEAFSVTGQFSSDEAAAEADQIEVEPEEAEDDGFYFDAAEEDEMSIAGVAAAAVPDTGESFAAGTGTAMHEPAVAMVETQLRELSEEDLKLVVAKVAGPIIEKMAGEMLEQIAWEVVPDLAEALIKEEIRKIKAAVSN